MPLPLSQTPGSPRPYATPGAQVAATANTSTSGFTPMITASNSGYIYNHVALAHEYFGAASLISAGAKVFRLKRTRPDGRVTGNRDKLQVWGFVIRTTAYATSDWTLKVSNLTNADAVTTQVNGGSTTAAGGEWVALGAVYDDHTASAGYVDIEIKPDVTTNIAAGDGVFAVSILPKATFSSMPQLAGGYSNDFAPVEERWGARYAPVTPFLLRRLQKNVIQTYEYAAEMIHCSSSFVRNGASGWGYTDNTRMYDRMVEERPVGVDTILGSVYCGVYNVGFRFLVFVINSAGEAIAADIITPTAIGWYDISIDISDSGWAELTTMEVITLQSVTAGGPLPPTISTFNRLSLWWEDATYGA